MNYTARQMASITGSQLIGDGGRMVQNIAFDSRILFSVQQTAFIAINTSKNSGEKYINTAVEAGVQVIISEHEVPVNKSVTLIITENSITFLQKLAKYHLQQFPGLKTIGITGSNGKTIVKEWLYQCLCSEFSTVKSPKSFNSQIGLPVSLLQIDERHQLGIFEAGISKPGEMEKLEAIFSPEIGILTHIGTAHSAHFDSEEQLIDEKIKLFQHSGIIIFNGDKENVYNKIHQVYSSKKLISYGLCQRNDLHIISEPGSHQITVSFAGSIFSFPVQATDEATLTNALAIIAVLKELKFSNQQIIEKLNALKSVEMRLESINGIHDNLIINDSYNLDLDSLKIAFQFINEYNKDKKILVLTDIVEAREDPEGIYTEAARLVNEQKFHKVFLIGEGISKFSELFHTETSTFNTTEQLIESQDILKIYNSLILLKGARKFEIEKLKNILELQKHDTVMEVNLHAILNNINVHRTLLKPETKIMAMVKAYSYGLGGYEIAEFLQHHHIDYLGVAYADEGAELRKKGITTPIIVMNPEQHSYNAVIDYNLEPEIYSFRVLELFYKTLQEKGADRNYPVHIKLETGMQRLGFHAHELDELIEKLNQMNLKVASIFSHLSSADAEEEKKFTLQQINTFITTSDYLIAGIKDQPIRHILNSSGITNFPEYQLDMVRIGIGMMGISSQPEIKKQLQSAVVLKTVISQISKVKKGESVGYNRNHKTPKDTLIATIPVGYADGIPRLIGNSVGFVGIKDRLYPIVGNICMDMMMVDLQDADDIQEGDEVIIFNSNPSLEEFSKYCNTIPYEVLTSISRRVKRIYIKK